ncbi:hypothetical protein M408DRAFT_304142 [Serendipita vermifera MAFF 305830]|uniref:Uncharacterized protein n=1 Tax=Serendipita vermifera MAFF 305830 TaxID=933852 RepID=A0A0C2XMF4_SERVB|nr:hypothetical protein M408DRAFT_304142 [Serendipita vermifera MAFF 305830]
MGWGHFIYIEAGGKPVAILHWRHLAGRGAVQVAAQVYKITQDPFKALLMEADITAYLRMIKGRSYDDSLEMFMPQCPALALFLLQETFDPEDEYGRPHGHIMTYIWSSYELPDDGHGYGYFDFTDIKNIRYALVDLKGYSEAENFEDFFDESDKRRDPEYHVDRQHPDLIAACQLLKNVPSVYRKAYAVKVENSIKPLVTITARTAIHFILANPSSGGELVDGLLASPHLENLLSADGLLREELISLMKESSGPLPRCLLPLVGLFAKVPKSLPGHVDLRPFLLTAHHLQHLHPYIEGCEILVLGPLIGGSDFAALFRLINKLPKLKHVLAFGIHLGPRELELLIDSCKGRVQIHSKCGYYWKLVELKYWEEPFTGCPCGVQKLPDFGLLKGKYVRIVGKRLQRTPGQRRRSREYHLQSVVSGILSESWIAPTRFGDRRLHSLIKEYNLALNITFPGKKSKFFR